MDCNHDGYHTIWSEYEREQGVITYVGRCDECGARLREFERVEYRPDPNPHGNDPYLNSPSDRP